MSFVNQWGNDFGPVVRNSGIESLALEWPRGFGCAFATGYR